MTKQDKMKITNLLVRIKQIEDEIERLRLFDNQIEANYNRVFDYGVTNRIILDEQCIGELKAKFEAKSCDFVKTAQAHAVQDFAEKVKEQSETFLSGLGNGTYIEKDYVSVEYIEELAKHYGVEVEE